MTHKVHPKIFRIQEVTTWDSRGFYKKPAKELEEDFKIREFLNKKLGKVGIAKIELEKFPGKINVIIFSARPGLIIGRGGKGIEELKKGLENEIFKEEKKELRIEIVEVRDPWLSASLASQWIAQQIERRIPYRRVLKQALEKISAHKEIQGARVEVAGRLGGTEISRREWLKKGRLPRQTIRADIDYAQARAYCAYGVVGIKVWMCKGERFAK